MGGGRRLSLRRLPEIAQPRGHLCTTSKICQRFVLGLPCVGLLELRRLRALTLGHIAQPLGHIIAGSVGLRLTPRPVRRDGASVGHATIVGQPARGLRVEAGLRVRKLGLDRTGDLIGGKVAQPLGHAALIRG